MIKRRINMEYDKKDFRLLKDDHLQPEFDIIWDALHSYAETCLGNKVGQDAENMEYADEWAKVCEAMSTIQDSLCDGEGCGYE
tara:strand:+ start:1043 stop:1291 length:249 start_codon:yes stop_codon:yes gene_type:complete